MLREGAGSALLAAVLALALGACSTLVLPGALRLAAEDWPTEGGGPQRAGATEAVLRPPLEPAWRYDAEGGFGPAAALVAGGTLLVATLHGEVHALEAAEGTRLGAGELGEALLGAPALTARTLFAPATGGKHGLLAYDIVRGRPRWKVQGDASAGVLLLGEDLVAAFHDGSVRRLAQADGAELWHVVPDSGAAFAASPVLLPDDAVAVADDRGRVTAIEAASGRVRWTAELGAPVPATPAAAEGRLFVPTAGGRLVALEAATGEVLWALEAASPLVRFAAPSVAGGLVVVGASDGRMRALEAATGEERWSFRTDGNFAAAPLLTPGVVYAGALDRMLYALDREDGSVLWKTELEGRIKTAPVVARGLLIVLAEPRFVHAFAPAAVAHE